MTKTFPVKGKTVAVTGATGFIGPYLIDALAHEGAHIRALTRRSQSVRKGVEWVQGSLQDTGVLTDLCLGADAVIHAAGAIKARRSADFFITNTDASLAMAEAAMRGGVRRFLLLSSLAARSPQLSDYAASKRAGEDAVIAALTNHIPWTILRPPAVFGPGDMETLKIFKSVKMGFAPLPHPNAVTAWIHAEDLARACVAALEYDAGLGGIWALDEGSGGYPLKDCYALIAKLLERDVKVFPMPKGVLTAVGFVNEGLTRLSGSTPMLTRGKVREICYPDWSVPSPSFKDIAPWTPQFSLEAGLLATLKWYRERKLL